MFPFFTSRFLTNWVLPFVFVSAIIGSRLFSQPLRAENEQPTQQNQQVYLTDYAPAMRGTIVTGQPQIHVQVNGVQDAVFAVDTGATVSIISAELAKKMRLSVQPAVADDGTPIKWLGKQIQMTRKATLEIGHVTVKDLTLLVIPEKSFVISSDGSPSSTFEGVVGVNILKHTALLIDAAQHKLGLCLPGNLNLGQLRQIDFPQPYVVPIIDGEKGWSTQAQFSQEGKKAEEPLLIDTGADLTSLSNLISQQLDLKAVSQQGQADFNGRTVVSKAFVDLMALGSLSLSNQPIIINSAQQKSPPLLGMDILSQYRVMLDFPGGKMYLQPLPQPTHKITIGPSPKQPPAP